MAKKFKSFERFLKPDPKYRSRLATKVINSIMEGGRKTLAQKIFYDALGILQKKIPNIEPVEVFTKAVENVKPLIEVRSRRVGGATYQVPKEVPPRRQQSLAIRWLLAAVRKKKGKAMHLRLADELLAAYKMEGEAVKKREDVHKMAEANKAFAHFAW